MRTIAISLVSALMLTAAMAHAKPAMTAAPKTKTPKRTILLMQGKKAPKPVKASALKGTARKALDAATKGFTDRPTTEQPEALTCTITAGEGMVYGWCHDGETFCYAGCTSEGCGAGCASCDGNC